MKRAENKIVIETGGALRRNGIFMPCICGGFKKIRGGLTEMR